MSFPPPPDSELPIQAAARLLAEGRPALAADRLEEIVRGAPTYAAAHVLHATALASGGDPEAALDAWTRAAALVPGSPLVHRERERLLEALQAPGDGDELPPPVPGPVERPVPTPGTDDPASVFETPLPAYGELQALSATDLFFGGPPASGPEASPSSPETEAASAPDEPGAPPPAAAAPGPLALPPGPVPVPAPADEEDGGWADIDRSTMELLPPEEGESLSLDVVPEEVDGEDEGAGDGWSLVTEEPVPSPPHDARVEPDVIAPEPSRPYTAADDLDALISQLEDAPRIKPDPGFSDPGVSFESGDMSEMYSETLAEIYAAQHQYVEAAVVYEKLAARRPDEADEMLRKAAALRERG